jgi:Holliday junction resolvase RusA-like endonuclease
MPPIDPYERMRQRRQFVLLPHAPQAHAHQSKQQAAVMLTFNLPEPPSVNRFKNFHRTDGAYPAWKTAAGWEIKLQAGKIVTILGPVQVDMTFARGGDIDNRVKPLLDLLQYMRVIENDKQVERLVAQFGEAPGRCRVTLLPLVGTVK